MAEKIYIDRKEANELVYEADNDDYEVIHKEQYDSGRWESYHLIVIKRKSDGKLFISYYARGLTECQEREPFEKFDANKDDKVEFDECEAKEVVHIEYVPVKD